jgi:hypothetical protein
LAYEQAGRATPSATVTDIPEPAGNIACALEKGVFNMVDVSSALLD